MKKTVLILIDGLCIDALSAAATPNLDFLMANGASCMHMASVTPSLTLPAHFSLFTSLAPYAHGVMSNAGQPDPSVTAQSLFYHIRSQGGAVSSFTSWEHLRRLAPPGILDHSLCLRLHHEKDLVALAGAAAGHMISRRPDFCFVYFEWTDVKGHEFGWMSPEYLEALEITDQAVGSLMETLLPLTDREGVNLVVASDHGGKSFQHYDAAAPEISRVPFIAWGPGIRKARQIKEPMSLMDVAPTIAGLMGIPPHFAWEGKDMSEAMKSRMAGSLVRKAG